MIGVVVREAEERDTSGVHRLCRQLDRCDYLLRAWDQWMRTPGDLNLVAEAEGRIVGCVHAGVLSPTETFLQGLRVDPAMRRRGAGSRLMAELDAGLRRRGLDIQRAVTAQGNGPARRLLATLGWSEVHAVTRRRRQTMAAAGAVGTVVPLATAGAGVERPPLARVAAIVDHQPLLASRPGLAFFRRIYFAAPAAAVAEAVAAGHVLGIGDACLFLDPPSPGNLWIHSVAGPAPSALRLLATLLDRGAGGRGALTIEAPADAAIQKGLDALGFAPAGPHDRYVVVEAPAPTVLPGQVGD